MEEGIQIQIQSNRGCMQCMDMSLMGRQGRHALLCPTTIRAGQGRHLMEWKLPCMCAVYVYISIYPSQRWAPGRP
jgi:hypothetical protein